MTIRGPEGQAPDEPFCAECITTDDVAPPGPEGSAIYSSSVRRREEGPYYVVPGVLTGVFGKGVLKVENRGRTDRLRQPEEEN